MMRKVLLVLFLISTSACKQKLEDVSIRSLSGKNSGPNLGISSPLRLVKDFNQNMLALIDEKVIVPGGFYFTLNNGDHINGLELFYFDNATGSWGVVFDSMPGVFESGEVSGLYKYGDYIWFTSIHPTDGRELYRINISTKLVTYLGDLTPGSDGTFTKVLNMDGNENDGNNIELAVIDQVSNDNMLEIYFYGSAFAAGEEDKLLEIIFNTSDETLVKNDYGTSIQKITRISGLENSVIISYWNSTSNENDSLIIRGSNKDDFSGVFFNKKIFLNGTSLIAKNNSNELYSIDPTVDEFLIASNVDEFVIFQGNIYYTANNSLYHYNTFSLLIDQNGSNNNIVANLTVVGSSLCFSDFIELDVNGDSNDDSDINTNDGVGLVCGEAGTSGDPISTFVTHDFNLQPPNTTNEIYEMTTDGTSLYVSAVDGFNSSLFKTTPPLSTVEKLATGEAKFYNWIFMGERDLFLSGTYLFSRSQINYFKYTFVNTNSSLQNITDFGSLYKSNIIGNTANGSSFAFPMFSKGNYVFGNFFGNLKESWVIDSRNDEVTILPIGHIKDEDVFEHNGKYYLTVSYKAFPDIVEFDPATKAYTVLSACGMVGGSSLTNPCDPNKSLEIKLIDNGYIYYTAVKMEDPALNDSSLWVYNIGSRSTVEHLKDTNNLDIKDADDFMTFNSEVIFTGHAGGNITGLFYIVNDNVPVRDTVINYIAFPPRIDQGKLIAIKVFSGDTKAYMFTAKNNWDLINPAGDPGDFEYEFLNNKWYLTDTTSNILFKFDGTSAFTSFATSFSEVENFNDEAKFLAKNSNDLNIYTDGVLERTYPNLFSSISCTSEYEYLHESPSSVVYRCDNSGDPTYVRFSNGVQVNLSDYGLIEDSLNDLLLVYSNSNKVVLYSKEDDSNGDVAKSRIVEVTNDGKIFFKSIETNDVQGEQLKPGVFFLCSEDSTKILDFENDTKVVFEDYLCPLGIGQISIRNSLNNKTYFSFLELNLNSSVGLEIYGLDY